MARFAEEILQTKKIDAVSYTHLDVYKRQAVVLNKKKKVIVFLQTSYLCTTI